MNSSSSPTPEGSPALECQDDARREAVRADPHWNGMDYLDVDAQALKLTVYFLDKAPDHIKKENLIILGGRRVTGIRVTRIQVCRRPEVDRDDCLQVWVDKWGDFSTYTLCLVAVDENKRPIREPGPGGQVYQPLRGIDPRYACLDFSFMVDCPSGLDCLPEQVCVPPQAQAPELNYLAKDYASFRQLILDRLALTLPGWTERHVPDLGIALVEVLAYTGDYLSYYQDAVATEAYLDTARQRVSVRRHARLVDYALHEGCNARAWMCVSTDSDLPDLPPEKVAFLAGYPGSPSLLPAEKLAQTPGSYTIFEPVERRAPLRLRAAHSRIRLYTWGGELCCLPRGATAATLIDAWAAAGEETPPGKQGAAQYPPVEQQTAKPEAPAREPDLNAPRLLSLRPGDFLLFEEVLGPETGAPADADPTHRHAVRLTRVTPGYDRLYHQPVLEVEWARADALPFPLCVSHQGQPPECAPLEDVSVACGNVILVDYGQTVPDEHLGTVPAVTPRPVCEGDCASPPAEPGEPFTAVLKDAPLTFSQPLPPGKPPASGLVAQDPRLARPAVTLTALPPAPGGAPGAPSQPAFALEDLGQGGYLMELAQSIGLLEAADAEPRRTSASGKGLLTKVQAPELLAAQPAAVQFLRWQLTPGLRGALKAAQDPAQIFASPGKGPLAAPGEALQALAAELEALALEWTPQPDLLNSGERDRHFVVEIDDEGLAHLRFGDGDLGERPAGGTAFYATYRVGNGPQGNVGAETITTLVLRGITLSGAQVDVRNPLPAQGGSDPESLAQARLLAPQTFRSEIQRAITPEDYVALVMRFFPGQVQRAAARLSWTGSWYEMQVVIDPFGEEMLEAGLLQAIERRLRRYRRMGHALAVRAAEYVPLEVTLEVCVQPNTLRGHVEAALLDLFSNRRLPGGRLGFFHPDNLSFGDSLRTSRMVALARSVPGVLDVQVTALKRYGSPGPAAPDTGILPLGGFEIARLDNDPNSPENGRFRLTLVGGR